VTTTQVRVEPDLSNIREAVVRNFPTANVRIEAGAEGIVIVTGSIDNGEEIQPLLQFVQGYIRNGRVVNSIRVSGVMQVQLEVCLARVQRSELRSMAFDFLYSDQQNFLASTIGGAIATPDIAPRGGVGTFSGDFHNTLLPAGHNITFGITDLTSAFFGFLRALQQENLAKIITNPSLVTFNGRPASLRVGGEQPYPVPAALGQPPSVEFKPFGTQLDFTPYVLGNGKIRLEIASVVSRLDFANGILLAGTQIPQIVDQRVSTMVELENGQTLVIGGLMENEVNAVTQKVPVLGSLPFVGAAFRNIRHEEREVELLVLVTPRLVDPMDCSQRTTKLPGQETRTPSDFELFLEGILEAPRGPREIAPDGTYRPAHWLDSQGGAGACPTGTCAPTAVPTATGHAAQPVSMSQPVPPGQGMPMPMPMPVQPMASQPMAGPVPGTVAEPVLPVGGALPMPASEVEPPVLMPPSPESPGG
jgi:pilus assembly protein CpaC